MKFLICIIALVFSVNVFAVQSFMPENNLHLEDSYLQKSNVDKYQFDQILMILRSSILPFFDPMDQDL